jgi:hypothetical protein
MIKLRRPRRLGFPPPRFPLALSSPRGRAGEGSPGGEGARRAGSPSEVARSAHEAGLTGGDSTAVAALRPGRDCEAEKPGGARLCDRVRGGTPSTAPARTTRPSRGRTRSMSYTLRVRGDLHNGGCGHMRARAAVSWSQAQRRDVVHVVVIDDGLRRIGAAVHDPPDAPATEHGRQHGLDRWTGWAERLIDPGVPFEDGRDDGSAGHRRARSGLAQRTRRPASRPSNAPGEPSCRTASSYPYRGATRRGAKKQLNDGCGTRM